MSKFKIYTSKGISFKRIERLNKAFYYSSAIIPLAGTLVFIGDKLNMPNYVPIIIIALWLITIVSLIIFSRFVNKSLDNIGYLSLSVNNIKKIIGDLVTNRNFEEISEIKINRHLVNLFFSPNPDGSTTYLLSILDKNEKTELLVISSQSEDKPFMNFHDLMRKIVKRNKIKLIFR